AVVAAQANVNAADAALNLAKANLSAADHNDQAAVSADQAAVSSAQSAVNFDNSSIAADGTAAAINAAIATDKSNIAADISTLTPALASSCTPPVAAGNVAGCAALANHQDQLSADQAKLTRLNSDKAALVLDNAALAKAQGALQTAQAKLKADDQTLSAQEKSAETDVINAQAQEATAVRQAAAQVAEAQATAAKDADANQGALNTAIVQLQNSKIAYQNTSQTDANQVAQAQTHADQTTHAAQGTLSEATTNLQNTLAELAALTNGQIPNTVLQDEAQVSADQTQVRSATDNVAGTQLVAPVDGTVTQVNVADGQAIGSAASSAGALAASAASGQPTAGNNAQGNLTHALVMTTPQAFQVSGPVSDAQLPLVHPGDQVNVIPAGGGEQLLGHVTGIAPSALITQGVATFTVTAIIDGINPNVHTGSTAQMSIVVERDVDVLTVPTSAVHTTGASSYVLVDKGNG
ncbi:MAG: hypothetical protein ACREQ5_19745, partial [Candidatus Dormibacteria bacterium]